MTRLKRFEEHRFLGTRDDMKVYDCDEEEQLHMLEERVEGDDLLRRDLLQSFAPDTAVEAYSRGFSREI